MKLWIINTGEFREFRFMKYFFALPFLLLAGCSAPTTPGPFAPGGKDYVAPGKFVGIWAQGKVVDSCTSFVMEADSIFSASVINSSTGEVLTLKGEYDPTTIEWANGPFYHLFAANDSSNFYGDTDKAPNFLFDVNCEFSPNADTLIYSAIRGVDTLTIFCKRQ
jgi:hypothetical protein